MNIFKKIKNIRIESPIAYFSQRISIIFWGNTRKLKGVEFYKYGYSYDTDNYRFTYRRLNWRSKYEDIWVITPYSCHPKGWYISYDRDIKSLPSVKQREKILSELRSSLKSIEIVDTPALIIEEIEPIKNRFEILDI